MKIYANQLASHLKQGLQSCYLIVGDEPLGLKEATDSIRKTAKLHGFTEREVLHVDAKFKWETLYASMGTMSLFAEKKIIELHLPTGKPGTAGSKAIVQFVENIPSDIMLLIQCQEWSVANDKTKWTKTIEKTGTFMRVYMPKANEFGGWLQNRCRQIGLSVDTEAIALLSIRLEGNLLAAAQELEKLKMRFSNQNIVARDIALLVADSARFDVFRLTDALLENQLARTLRMIRGLKQDNTAIVVIHWALERQLRALLHFAYYQQTGQRIGPLEYRQQGVWQNQQAAIQSALKRLSVEKLEFLLGEIATLDKIIKGQAKGEPWLAMEQYIIAVCT
ncbi:MAG: DNA polymerase III subunit delta [Proteobacteria bacterium]|nr:DNA polymerase III subunit delta [Pseudomonadota bacterium]